jgi:hypothetical protein
MATLLNEFPRSMGCPNQNFIAFDSEQRNDYVKRHIKKSDIYTSVYAFNQLDSKHELDRDSAIIDKVFFDFDSTNWFTDMMKLHKWCQGYNLLHRCHFSGNGAHVFIYVNKDIQHKKEAIGNFQRWIQNQLDLCIDTKIIGDTSRIFRYPNTWNFKGRRFCIPIPESVLNSNLTEEWLWKHSTKQLHENAWCGKKLLNLKRWDTESFMYMESEVEAVNLKDINPNISITYPQFPPCIQQWLSTPDLRDDQKFHLIIYLKDQLVTPAPFDNAEIVSILRKSLSDDEFKHFFGTKALRRHQGHNGIKFRSIMKKDYYMLGCEELQAKGLCKKDCGRRNPIYD